MMDAEAGAPAGPRPGLPRSPVGRSGSRASLRGVRGFRIANIVRFAGIGAALIAPLGVIYRPDALAPFFIAVVGLSLASLASMGANLTHGAYRRGQYLRIEHCLAVRRPGARGGYRASGNQAIRVEVDGLLVSEALPCNVVLSRALVVMTTNGFTTGKKLYHVSLVDRALVVRVARFVVSRLPLISPSSLPLISPSSAPRSISLCTKGGDLRSRWLAVPSTSPPSPAASVLVAH